MSNKIKHTGIVDEVERNCVHVRILQSSACSGCKVAAHCNASETKEKVIDVVTADAHNYQRGDNVVVVADSAVGFRASLYGYLLPLLLMVATLVALLAITKSEGIAALSAIGVLAPYYLMVYLLRNQIKNKLNFEIQQ